MNRNRAADLLPIITAFSQGKSIQYRLEIEGQTWKDLGDNCGFIDQAEYRIKPEPRKVWIVEDRLSGLLQVYNSVSHHSSYIKIHGPFELDD